jgi:6-phosphogluconolactonase
MAAPRQLRIFDTSAELFQAAAAEFATLASQSVGDHGRFTVVLSGGSTPRGLYSLVAQDRSLPWDRICFFWGDERHVPPDHPDSNYHMANEALLAKAPMRPQNVFRIPAENGDAQAAATAYEDVIKKFFGLQPCQFPRFDLILLGMGPDGHTASLFPDTAALKEASRLVVANWVAKFQAYRITLTLPVLNSAACVMFLVSGSDKAEAMQDVLQEDNEGPPAKWVRPADGQLIWLVDRAAAALSGRK